MVTVVDPTGTPSPVYNRSGVTIVSLSVSATPPFASIPAVSGWTVAALTATVADPSVVLPAGADIGDVVEVHLLPGSSTRVFVSAPAGETVDSGQVSEAKGRLFRKIASTRWVAVGAPPQRLVPAGVVLPFAGAVAPAGFLLCAGQAVSRADHADLLAAIGTTYGAGDGTTTFNLPDLRGRVAAGKDNMGGTSANRLGFASALGASGGSQTHALTAAENGPHAHNATAGTNFALANAGTAFGFTTTSGNYIGYASVTDPSGSGTPHNNVQPTLVLNHIIST